MTYVISCCTYCLTRKQRFCNHLNMIDTSNKGAATELPTDLAEVREYLLHRVQEGHAGVDEILDIVLSMVVSTRLENRDMALRLAALLKHSYGRRSEKVDPNQLSLLLGQANAPLVLPEFPDRPATSAPKPAADAPLSAPKARPGRKPLPANLPRETVVLEPPVAERVCVTCGAEKACIGSESSELIEYIPAAFKVIVQERRKYACRTCQDGVVIAAVGDKVIEKGRPGPGLIAHVVVSKYQDHCPLNRLSGIYARSGVEIPTSTLGDWVTAGADALRPLSIRIARRVLDAHVVGVDDTGLRVLDSDHEHGVKRGHMWAYVGDGQAVAFRYTPTWIAAGPASFLVSRKGIIQGDGYAGYARIVAERKGDLVLAGCWAHARRKFVEAMESGDARAAVAVELIGKMYQVERGATEDGCNPEERARRRDLFARPVLDQLGRFIAQVHPNAPPKSPLGKALTYTINQWETLKVYLGDGRVPIDNNAVERALRPICVGRKNYLFAGSDAGARRAETIYSVLGTAALVGIDPVAYIRNVLDRISRGWPGDRIDELLPDAWAAQQAANNATA